jgi:hypothetical protein
MGASPADRRLGSLGTRWSASRGRKGCASEWTRIRRVLTLLWMEPVYRHGHGGKVYRACGLAAGGCRAIGLDRKSTGVSHLPLKEVSPAG